MLLFHSFNFIKDGRGRSFFLLVTIGNHISGFSDDSYIPWTNWSFSWILQYFWSISSLSSSSSHISEFSQNMVTIAKRFKQHQVLQLQTNSETTKLFLVWGRWNFCQGIQDSHAPHLQARFSFFKKNQIIVSISTVFWFFLLLFYSSILYGGIFFYLFFKLSLNLWL